LRVWDDSLEEFPFSVLHFLALHVQMLYVSVWHLSHRRVLPFAAWQYPPHALYEHYNNPNDNQIKVIWSVYLYWCLCLVIMPVCIAN